MRVVMKTSKSNRFGLFALFGTAAHRRPLRFRPSPRPRERRLRSHSVTAQSHSLRPFDRLQRLEH